MALYTISAEVLSNAGASRGTITRVLSFRSFGAINQIGSGEFTLALDDTQSIDLINENDFVVVTVTTPSRSVVVARFIASEPKKIINDDGSGYFSVAGPDFLHELTRRNLGYTIISDGSGGKDAGAGVTILALSDNSWVWVSFSAPGTGAYMVASGETVWDAYLNYVTQAGLFLSLGMTISTPSEPEFRVATWLPTHAFQSNAVGSIIFDAMKLIDGADDTTSDEYPILSFEIVKDSTQEVTRVHAFGAGTGEDRLTLADATTAPPAGFSVDTVNSIITNTALEAITNQPIIEKVQHFSHIKSEDPEDAVAIVTAANELQQAGITWLQEHSGSNTTYYRIKTVVKGAHQPGQLVTLTHTRTSPWDAAGAENNTNVISINDTFVLLEYGLSIDGDGNLVADCLLGDAPIYKPTGDRVMAKRVKDLEKVVRHANSGQSVGQPVKPQGQDASFVLVAGSAALANDRAATAGDGIDLTDAGAGSTLTWAVDVTAILGDGLIEVANNLTLGTPSTLTISTTNAVTTTSHTHAITTTSDGTADTIVKTGNNGRITAEDFVVPDGGWFGEGASGTRIILDTTANTFTLLGGDLNLGTGDLLQLRGATNGVESTASDIYGVNQLGIAAESNALIFIDANANSTTDYFAILKDAEVRTSATEILRVNESGALIIGDTDHSGLTQGIKINQGANDDDLFQASSTDVAHGMTTLVDTQVYGKHKKRSATDGGYQIHGLTEGVEGLAFLASATTAVTTDTSSSLGAMTFRSYVKSGTDHVNMGATDNTHVFRNGSVTTMLLKGNGVLHLTDATPVALDDYDDVALLRTFNKETAVRGVIDSQWDKFVQYNRTHLENAGVLVGDFVSVQGMQRLMSGAVWQLHERIAELEAKLGNA